MDFRIKSNNQKTLEDYLKLIIFEETGFDIEEVYDEDIMKVVLDDESLIFTIISIRVKEELGFIFPNEKLHSNMTIKEILDFVKELKNVE